MNEGRAINHYPFAQAVLQPAMGCPNCQINHSFPSLRHQVALTSQFKTISAPFRFRPRRSNTQPSHRQSTLVWRVQTSICPPEEAHIPGAQRTCSFKLSCRVISGRQGTEGGQCTRGCRRDSRSVRHAGCFDSGRAPLGGFGVRMRHVNVIRGDLGIAMDDVLLDWRQVAPVDQAHITIKPAEPAGAHAAAAGPYSCQKPVTLYRTCHCNLVAVKRWTAQAKAHKYQIKQVGARRRHTWSGSRNFIELRQYELYRLRTYSM